MQFDAINARISSIRDDAEETGRFVEEYKPFIASCTEKVTGRFVNYGSDDELSIAMIAFVEAIRSFDSSKGNFFSFSRNVIKRRLIENQDLMHKKLAQGVMLLLNRAVEQGYLSGDADDPQGVQDMPGGSAGPQTGAVQTPDEEQPSEGDTHSAGGGGEAENDRKDSEGTTDPSQLTEENTAGQSEKQPAGGSKLNNAVLLTVSSSNAKKTGTLKKIIQDTTARELDKGRVDSKVLVGETSVKQRQAAHKLGVTPGKLVLIEEASRSFSEADFEKMKNTAVKDLLKMVMDKDENKHMQGPGEKKADEPKKEKPEPGAPGKDRNSARDDAGDTVRNKDKDKDKDKDKSKAGPNTGKADNRNIGKNTDNNSRHGDSKPGGVQGGSPKEDKSRDSKTGPGAVGNNDKKGGNNNGKSIGADKQKNNSKETASTKKNQPGWDDIKKALEKQSEELKKERERLREDLLRQITGNKKKDSNVPNGPGRNGSDAGKDSRDNKAKNDKGNEKDRKQKDSGKKR